MKPTWELCRLFLPNLQDFHKPLVQQVEQPGGMSQLSGASIHFSLYFFLGGL